MLVAIDVAPERSLRVVQVQQFQAWHSDQPIELFERLDIAACRSQIVPCSEQMTRIETDAEAFMIVGVRQDRGQLFERGTKRRTLSRGLLEEDHRASPRARAKERHEGLGDQLEPRRFASIC